MQNETVQQTMYTSLNCTNSTEYRSPSSVIHETSKQVVLYNQLIQHQPELVLMSNST